MDKKWMLMNRLSKEYREGVDSFLKFASEHASNPEFIKCPCVNCGNLFKLNCAEIKNHLICNGIDVNYNIWKWHGEKQHSVRPSLKTVRSDDKMYDDFEDHPVDMVNDLVDHSENFENLIEEAKKLLFPGSESTKLASLIRLYNLKARNGWSDKGFSELLSYMKDTLPKDNEMPVSMYEAKKILTSMGMGYEKIHACPNDCILFRKEYASEIRCPICNSSRWKIDKISKKEKVGIPAKVLWYIPIIPRFKSLFRNPKHSKNLRWHEERRIKDGKLRHPADTLAWKKVDEKWPKIKEDPRNLRLGLSSDGFNPYGTLSNSYSCWPVLLVIYNLPPRLCMKRKFTMLTLLIPGPKQPGNDIDVYLAPLIDDLKQLWDGIDCFDGDRNEHFALKAVLLWTISDFPAYGNLSGCTVKGKKACPLCGEKTHSKRLKHGNKECFMGHRRYLERYHPYRRHKKAFDGKQEFGEAPKPLSGEEVYEKVSRLTNFFGKGKKDKKKYANGSEEERQIRSLWKKKSIFFELEYWQHLLLRHNLDVMHIEKNVCDSIIGTLFNIPGKTKDGRAAREDLEEMGIRKELAIQKINDRICIPPACFTLKKEEKIRICETLANVKVPEGYSSNIRSLVSMKDLKLTGLKSHDCHILMQQLLPIALQSVLDKKVRYAITRLCFFFNAICTKVVDVSKLEKLQEEIIMVLCLLEMYFPPSFFDIMIHLTVHLVREIKLCGPVYLRWMYPFERHMKILKGYVRNRNRPEASIVECYIAEEAIEFCSEYVSDAKAIGICKPSQDTLGDGKGVSSGRVEEIDNDHDWKLAHRNVLTNSAEVQPYIGEHLEWLKMSNPSKSEKWIQDEHYNTFITWFKEKIRSIIVKSSHDVSETLRWISLGPTHLPIKYDSYVINGRRFNTKALDDTRVNQNSGVSIVAKTMQFASSKDKSPVYVDMTYYGVIQEIWELDYRSFRVPVFKCNWVNNINGVKRDNMLIMVDLKRLGYPNDPFIMATQAKQVFYVSLDSTWSAVVSTQPRNINDDDDDDDDLDGDPLEELETFAKEVGDVDEFNDEELMITSHVREDGDAIWIDP